MAHAPIAATPTNANRYTAGAGVAPGERLARTFSDRVHAFDKNFSECKVIFHAVITIVFPVLTVL